MVIPALDPNDSFAAEQAGLALACLDWVLDVHASEYPCERTEHADYRETLATLADLDPGAAGDVRALLDETYTPPADLAGLRDQGRRLKEAVAHSYRLLAGSPAASAAHRAVAETAARQAQRELAWCRLTGFPRGDLPNIADVLAEQGRRAVRASVGATP
ncbi:MAG TPA: hypothetical protein VIW24_21435 [Aldersonia sp.]